MIQKFLKWTSCNKIAHVTSLSWRLGMGKLLCSKSANLCTKPTSDCRIVENMLIACSKYIGTHKIFANICYKCFKMLQHANAWNNSGTPHVFFFWRFFFTLYYFLYIMYYILLSFFLIINFTATIYYFLFSYDSIQLMRTAPDKRYHV